MCFRRPCPLQMWSCGRRCILSYLTLVLTPVRAHSSVRPLRLQDSYLMWFSSAGELRSVCGWFEWVGGLEACQAAARRVLQGNGVEALKTFLQKQPATQTQRRDSPAYEVHRNHSINYTTKGFTHSLNLLSFLCFLQIHLSISQFVLCFLKCIYKKLFNMSIYLNKKIYI